MEFKIDRSNWKKVKLGEVAFEYSKRINNPSESEFDRFVGSSNIDQWDFRVKSWETTDSVTSAMKLFEPRDYLLVRRSLYASDFRERAPRATFHGVCSGDILTIKENPEKVVDGFLIGVFNSPALWKYIVSNASGSITRRIKWKDLANYEFLLPPKEQQAQLAELLWAMDEVIEREREVLERLRKTKNALQRETFERSEGHFVEIQNIAKVYSGGTPNRKINKYWGGNIPWIKTAEVNYQVINKAEEFITEEGLRNSAAKLIPIGSVLVAMYGQGVTRGRVAITGLEATCNQACAVIVTSNSVNSWFIYSYLEYKYEDLRSLAHGANQQNLNLRMIKEFNIPDLEIDIKKSFLEKKLAIDNNYSVIEKKVANSHSLQKSLINQIF